MSYQTLQEEAQRLHSQAEVLETEAEEAHLQDVKQKGLNGWLNYNFESSSGLTPEFALFSKQVKAALGKLMVGYEMIDYSRGHFEFSAFFKNITTNKLVYVSCSDVRSWPNGWFNNLLIRTATGPKDYTGGSNNYATLPGLKSAADRLTA